MNDFYQLTSGAFEDQTPGQNCGRNFRVLAWTQSVAIGSLAGR